MSAHHSTWEVFSIPTVTVELLGNPLSFTVGGMSCSTHQERLLIRSALDLS